MCFEGIGEGCGDPALLCRGIGVPLGTEEMWGPCPLWDWGVPPWTSGCRDPGSCPVPLENWGPPAPRGCGVTVP